MMLLSGASLQLDHLATGEGELVGMAAVQGDGRCAITREHRGGLHQEVLVDLVGGRSAGVALGIQAHGDLTRCGPHGVVGHHHVGVGGVVDHRDDPAVVFGRGSRRQLDPRVILARGLPEGAWRRG